MPEERSDGSDVLSAHATRRRTSVWTVDRSIAIAPTVGRDGLLFW